MLIFMLFLITDKLILHEPVDDLSLRDLLTKVEHICPGITDAALQEFCQLSGQHDTYWREISHTGKNQVSNRNHESLTCVVITTNFCHVCSKFVVNYVLVVHRQ